MISSADPTPLGKNGNQSPRRLARQITARTVLLLICLVAAVPLWWMVATAVKSDQELSVFPPTLWPKRWVWGNFWVAVNFIPFFLYLRNSLIVAGLTVLGAVLSNPIIAYGFSRVNWPGRDKVFLVVLATVFIPFPVLFVPLFNLFAALHWIDTFLPLVVPVFFGNAFWIFLMRQFLLQIPGELSDSARLDGANELQVFFRVILPMTLPAIGAVAIFAFIGAWNDFLGPLIYLNDNSVYTLAIGLTFFQSEHDLELNLLMAASALVIIPVVVVFIAFQRFFVEGVTVGSYR